MYKDTADIMEFIVISLFVVFFLFIVLVFFLSDKEIKHIGYVTKYDFVCTDGREIYNLTNFTIKKDVE